MFEKSTYVSSKHIPTWSCVGGDPATCVDKTVKIKNSSQTKINKPTFVSPFHLFQSVILFVFPLSFKRHECASSNSFKECRAMELGTDVQNPTRYSGWFVQVSYPNLFSYLCLVYVRKRRWIYQLLWHWNIAVFSCCSRFIVNVPEEERKDLVRLFFQIELAHWFYIDFYCSEENSTRKQCNIKEFSANIFKAIFYTLKLHFNKINLFFIFITAFVFSP